MMDIDYRIQLLEKDLAHAREMRVLMQARMDAHGDLLDRLLQGSTERFQQAEQRLDRIEALVEKLVTGLLRDHPNGH